MLRYQAFGPNSAARALSATCRIALSGCIDGIRAIAGVPDLDYSVISHEVGFFGIAAWLVLVIFLGDAIRRLVRGDASERGAPESSG